MGCFGANLSASSPLLKSEALQLKSRICKGDVHQRTNVPTLKLAKKVPPAAAF